MAKSQAEWMAEALAHAKAAKITPEEWVRRIERAAQGSSYGYAYKNTEMWKALTSLDAAAHLAPAPKPPAPIPNPAPDSSSFNGVGVFTAWDPAAAIPLAPHADWVAVQLDPEGGSSATPAQLRAAGFKRVFGWEARATTAGATKAWGLDLNGYIGQAESQPELEACLAIGVHPELERALVGNPTAWTDASRTAALSQGWDLIIEWYWNVMPWMTAIDSRGYPVDNVLFGTYDASSENPQYGRRVPLADYLVRGYANWSVYLAETLTPEDVERFKARRP